MNELALFAGAGGGLLASQLLGWDTKCAVEIDSGARRMLLRRQADGILPRFPIWDDIRTFDGAPWRGRIDVVSGGFPCQDVSSAGPRTGLSGARSGLVRDMLRVISEVRPTYVFAENSPNLRTLGLGEILEALSALGYLGRVGVLGPGAIGGPHKRDRMWIVAHAKSIGLPESRGFAAGSAADYDTFSANVESDSTSVGVRPVDTWWAVPRFARMDDGMADWVDRVKATGNGQVPAVAALAWRILSEGVT